MKLHKAGRFIPDWSQVRTREMDWTALKLLLEGIEPGKWRKRYRLAQEKKDSPNTLPSL
jgi:transposase